MSARIGWPAIVRQAWEIAWRRGHDMLIMVLVLLGALAVIAAVAWMAEHLIVFAGVALLMRGVFYLGRHERTTARPGQILLRQAQPEETAAAGAVPTATLPLAVLAAAFGWGQDQVALQPLPGLPAGLTGTRCSPTRYRRSLAQVAPDGTRGRAGAGGKDIMNDVDLAKVRRHLAGAMMAINELAEITGDPGLSRAARSGPRSGPRSRAR